MKFSSNQTTKLAQTFLEKHPIPGVKPADLEYSFKNGCAKLPGGQYQVEAHFTERFGWCLATLLISKSRRDFADRTYAVTLDGQQVRVGRGPHVKQTIIICVNAKNVERLAKHLSPILDKGIEQSHEIRDAISTKRARSVARRSIYGF